MPRPARTSRRRGLTLVESLVIVALISLAVTLALPVATDRAHIDARSRGPCLANLRQIGQALQGYAATWGGFPAAAGPGGESPHVALLPFLDQVGLHNAINFQLPMAASAGPAAGNGTVAGTCLAAYLCPADRSIRGVGFAGTSYRASLGACAACPDEGGGAFGPGVVHPPASFADGLGTTLACAEKAVGSAGAYDPGRDWIDLMTAARPTAAQWIARCAGQPVAGRGRLDAGGAWMVAGGSDTHFFTATAPNSPIPDCGSSAYNRGSGLFAARSRHPGGVNALMADGAARWFRSSVPLPIWRGHGTRAGAEMMLDPD